MVNDRIVCGVEIGECEVCNLKANGRMEGRMRDEEEVKLGAIAVSMG